VSDPDNILTTDERIEIDRQMQNIEQLTGSISDVYCEMKDVIKLDK
jgi:hypothetical protein